MLGVGKTLDGVDGDSLIVDKYPFHERNNKMLLFAHLGLTLAAGRIIMLADLAFLALGSILPDVIDKPLGLVVFGTPAMGRTLAHTLLFLLVLVALAVKLRDIRIASVSIGVFAHLILDFMWQSPVILIWPLFGNFPSALDIRTLSYVQRLLYGLRNPLVGLPEVLGLSYLLFFAFRSRSALVAKCQNLASTGRDLRATIQTLIKGH